MLCAADLIVSPADSENIAGDGPAHVPDHVLEGVQDPVNFSLDWNQSVNYLL